MIVGGADSSRGLFITEEEEPEGGTTLLYASAPILYIAPASIPDTLMTVRVIAAAWEVRWGKKGDMGKPIKSAPGTHQLSVKQVEGQKGAEAGGNVEADAAKQVAAAARLAAMMSSWCPINEVVVKNLEPVLVAEASPDVHDISTVPEMPATVEVNAQLKNYDGGTVSFYWDLTVEWTGPNKRRTKGVYTGQTIGENSDVTALPITWGALIRGGDEITLHVVAIGGTHSKEATLKNPFRIVGLNPSKQEIRAKLTLEEQVLAYLESGFRQFKQNRDFPLWGDPDGWGIMQVDPSSNDDQLWDWMKNVAEGKRRFQQEKVRLARTYAERVRNRTTWYFDSKGNRRLNDPINRPWEWYPIPFKNAEDLSDDELINEMFQRYNGGVFFRWEPDDPENPNTSGSWIRLHGITELGYGDKAHAVYTVVRKVQNGELPASYLPPGWN